MTDSSKQNPPIHKPEFLVVEDTKEIRTLLAIWISMHGATAVQAESGQEALDIIKKDLSRKWTCLFTDYQMDNIDGIQMIREMKGLGVLTDNWLLTSALPESDKNIQSLLLDYPDILFLPKPYSLALIISFIPDEFKS